jgi:flagellar biosynthesis anti-sigma factor FlgM
MKVTGNATPNPAVATEITSENSVAKAKGIDKARDTEAASGAHSSAAARAGSHVEISDKARMMQKATELVRQMPEVRADRVAQLKKSIGDGSYHVDSAALADKLLDEHLNTDFGKNNV